MAIQASVFNHGSKPASDCAIPLSFRLLVLGLRFILRVVIEQDGSSSTAGLGFSGAPDISPPAT